MLLLLLSFLGVSKTSKIIHPFIRRFLSNTRFSVFNLCLCFRSLKNSVIGSNRQKSSVLSQGVVPRLLQLLGDCSVPVAMKTECTVTLGSLAKGTDQHVQSLIDLGIVPLLLNGKACHHKLQSL